MFEHIFQPSPGIRTLAKKMEWDKLPYIHHSEALQRRFVSVSRTSIHVQDGRYFRDLMKQL